MSRKVNLIPAQWKTLASAFSNMGQAIILFSFAASFVPQAVSLPNNFSKVFAVLIFLCGLFFLVAGVIISKKEK